MFWHVELLDGQSTLRGGGFLKPKMLREFPDPITGFPLSTSDEIGVLKAVETLQDMGVPLNGPKKWHPPILNILNMGPFGFWLACWLCFDPILLSPQDGRQPRKVPLWCKLTTHMLGCLVSDAHELCLNETPERRDILF